jgi:RNA polymerase sigma factor (sigma-70 family)
MAAGYQDRSEAAIGFQRFLDWLDGGVGSDGAKYLELRTRLVRYFDRKNCVAPDDLADETLNRAARRLHEAGGILDASPAQYCYIVARYVFLEYLRDLERRAVSLDVLPEIGAPRSISASEEKAPQLGHLEHCLERLPPADRELIFEYYRGEHRAKIDNRQRLAARLGVTMNALSIRACRIRQKLENCVKDRECDDRFSKPVS